MSDRTLHTRQDRRSTVARPPAPFWTRHGHARATRPHERLIYILSPRGAAQPPVLYLYFTPPALWFICRLTNVVYFSVK